MPDHVVLEASSLTKTVPSPEGPLTILSDVSVAVRAGETLAIVGASGAGKSTLLALLAGLDSPSSGRVAIAGVDVTGLDEDGRAAVRGRHVGFVFQSFHLVPSLTALENVMLPMDFCDQWPAAERPERARALLQRLGVADQADKFPAALSGGQQQRVALARALANAPALILADEPTGNLDSANAEALLALLAELAREQGVTIVMVTHEAAALGQVRRSLRLRDGRLVEDRRHG